MLGQESFTQNIVCTNVKTLTQHSKHCPVAIGFVVKFDFQTDGYTPIETYSLSQKLKITQENKAIYQSQLISGTLQDKIDILRNGALSQQTIDSFEILCLQQLRKLALKRTLLEDGQQLPGSIEIGGRWA